MRKGKERHIKRIGKQGKKIKKKGRKEQTEGRKKGERRR